MSTVRRRNSVNGSWLEKLLSDLTPQAPNPIPQTRPQWHTPSSTRTRRIESIHRQSALVCTLIRDPACNCIMAHLEYFSAYRDLENPNPISGELHPSSHHTILHTKPFSTRQDGLSNHLPKTMTISLCRSDGELGSISPICSQSALSEGNGYFFSLLFKPSPLNLHRDLMAILQHISQRGPVYIVNNPSPWLKRYLCM